MYFIVLPRYQYFFILNLFILYQCFLYQPQYLLSKPRYHYFLNTNKFSKHLYEKGEKPYKCEQCSSGFAEKNKLRNHKRCHTGSFLIF